MTETPSVERGERLPGTPESDLMVGDAAHMGAGDRNDIFVVAVLDFWREFIAH